MCDLCVINDVKQRMLSEFSPSSTKKLERAGSSALCPSTLINGHKIIQDMTYTLTQDFPTFPGRQQVFIEQVVNYKESGYNLFEVRYEEHVGTHVDAPLHFSEDGSSVDELEVGQLFAPLCIIDIRNRALKDPDAFVTVEDIKNWQAEHGELPENACVAMLSGWGAKSGGDEFRNADENGIQHYPGFHDEAAQYLIEETSTASIAVDTLSLDCGCNSNFDVHYRWLPSGRFGIEALANLEKFPANGATIVIGAPKHKGGTGGPARVFGLI